MYAREMRGMNSRGHPGIFVGVGAGTMLIVLLLSQSFIGSGLFSTKTVTTTATVTVSTIPIAYEQVASAYANRFLLYEAKNVSALLNGYESNATVQWTGQAQPVAGNHTGSNEISTLLGIFPGQMENLTVTIDDQSPVVLKGDYLVIDSTFDFAGYSTVDGNIRGTIAAQDSYAHVGSSWLIARETWNILRFSGCEFPDCTVP
jgi:hypothetical protein